MKTAQVYAVLDRIDYWAHWVVAVCLGFAVGQIAFVIPMVLMALLFGRDHGFESASMIACGTFGIWVWIRVTPKIRRLHERIDKWQRTTSQK